MIGLCYDSDAPAFVRDDQLIPDIPADAESEAAQQVGINLLF